MLGVSGVRVDEFFVEVDGDERGGGVEDGGEVGHQGGGHGGEDEAAKAGFEEKFNEGEIGGVGGFEFWAEEFVRDDAGEDEEEGGNNVEIAGTDDTHARVPFIFGSQDALDHVLGGAGVPDADGEEAGEDAGEREFGVIDGKEDLEMVGGVVEEGGEPPYCFESQDGDDDAADTENDDLHEVGPGSGAQAAVDGVGTGEDGEEEDADDDLVVGIGKEAGVEERADHPLKRETAGVKSSREDGGDIPDEEGGGEDIAADRGVTSLEEFGDGVEIGADIIGEKYPDEDGVDDPGVPRACGGDNAVGEPDAGVGDEVLTGDVAGKHGGSDDVPREGFAAEEIAAGGFLFAGGDEETETDGEEEVEDENREVEEVEMDLLGH